MSSICSAGTPERPTASRIASAARSSGRTPESAPPSRPFKPNVVERTRQELADRFAALVAVVARVLVDVHVDETVAALGVHAAAKAERVLERLFAMLERCVDRLAQDLRYIANGLVAD